MRIKDLGGKIKDRLILAHQANCLTKKASERMKDPHCRVKAIYQSPIPTTVFIKSALSFSKQIKNGIGGVALCKLLGEGVLRKVYSREVGVVNQGIDDQLKVRMGRP